MQTFCPGGEIGRLAILRGWFSQGSAGSNPVQGTLIYFMAFRYFQKSDIIALTKTRDGETKIGNSIACFHEYKLCTSKPNYILLGIQEDIGVLANFGTEGAKNTFEYALKAFLNMQNNQFIDLTNICIGGVFDFEAIYQKEDFNSSLIDLRKYVETIDDEVSRYIQDFVQKGFTPIVIGGGHNNSYPILKGIFNAKQKALDCINIDPHFDFRALEGRHSGNGFSYAQKNGYLNEYAVFGFHENYNNQYMLDTIWVKNQEKFISFESLIFNNINYLDALQSLLIKFNDVIGLEIDLDSVAMMPTSAYTPSGFSFEDLRRFLYFIKNNKNIEYLHIAEGNVAQQMHSIHVSKSIAFLLADLLRK